MATQNSGTQAEPAPKPSKIESVGKMALKKNDTAEEAAGYVNGGSWGFRASAKNDKVDVGPKGWAGQARDNKWLILEEDRDAKS